MTIFSWNLAGFVSMNDLLDDLKQCKQCPFSILKSASLMSIGHCPSASFSCSVERKLQVLKYLSVHSVQSFPPKTLRFIPSDTLSNLGGLVSGRLQAKHNCPETSVGRKVIRLVTQQRRAIKQNAIATVTAAYILFRRMDRLNGRLWPSCIGLNLGARPSVPHDCHCNG